MSQVSTSRCTGLKSASLPEKNLWKSAHRDDRRIGNPNAQMNIADILFWEATNGLLLIPAWIVLVMLTRWMRGRPVFTERDWFFLIGHPREKVLAVHLWLRFATLWFAVVLVGSAEGYVLWHLWSRIIRWRGGSHCACSLASCAEVATLTSWLIRRHHFQFG